MSPIFSPTFARDLTGKYFCVHCYAQRFQEGNDVEGNKRVCPKGCDYGLFNWLYEVLILAPSMHVDLGLGDNQPGVCPEDFQDYCVADDGTACPYYHEGHCAKVPDEEEAP